MPVHTPRSHRSNSGIAVGLMTAAFDALHLHETRLDRAEIIQCVELGVRFSLLQLAIVDHLAQVAPLLAILRDLDLETYSVWIPSECRSC